MVTIACSPKFKKTNSFFEKIKETFGNGLLDKYGRMGVEALAEATPKDTGKTAASWYYTIERKNDIIIITWSNSNFNDGVPIAVILQYGHATRNGGYVQGIDYINPAMKPVFEKIAEDAWKEVKYNGV